MTASYSSKKELFLKYMKSDGDVILTVNSRAELGVWLGSISALLYLDGGKKDEV